MCVAISRRQRHAERADQVEHHLAARRGRLVEPVERAVHPVAGMVIDVDDELLLEARDAGAAEVAALHHDHRVDIGRSAAGARSRCGPCRESPGSDRGAASALTMRTCLPSASSAIGHRQLRADRVAVGPGVRGQQEALAARGSHRGSASTTAASAGAAPACRSLLIVAGSSTSRLASPGRAATAPPSRSSLSPWRICSMRSLVSIDSSNIQVSSGTRFSRSRVRPGAAGTASRARARARSLARLVVAERGVEHARLLQVGRRP